MKILIKKMTTFTRYYENQELIEFSMDELEELIKDEANKKIIAELIYQRYYNRFLKLFFYNSKIKLIYKKKNTLNENETLQNDFDTEYKNGFIIMTSCCLLIETIASYFEGNNQTKRSGNDVFNFIFTQAKEYNNELKVFLNEPFYKNVRCALLHQGETYDKFKIRRDINVLYDKENKIINAKLFCDALNKFLISYKHQLESEKWDNAIWDNCRLKLRHIIQNSI